MCGRYLGFVLLVWFPNVLHAQGAAQTCPAPSLSNGYFIPDEETFLHETQLTYGCDNGHKPAVAGWWATSTCQNGKWAHEPQCIDEKACFPPTIPNAKYPKNENGWYEEGAIIRVTCDEGYEHKDWDATAECTNGTWSSVPVCEKSIKACGEPPKIPHAVIIHQGHRELFAVDSEVQYECEDGYTVEGADKKSIFCIAGRWTEGPKCRSSSRSGSDTRDTQLQILSRCGNIPIVPHGEVVEINQMFLKYQCGDYYKRVGPETVVCYSNGMWSKKPTCKAAFCSVDTNAYPELVPVGVIYIKSGDTVKLECVKRRDWWVDHHALAGCSHTTPSLSRCCNWFQIKTNSC